MTGRAAVVVEVGLGSTPGAGEILLVVEIEDTP
jgi:hypothetical protein